MKSAVILAAIASLGAAAPPPTPPTPPVSNRVEDGSVLSELWHHRPPSAESSTGTGGALGIAAAPRVYTTTPACSGNSAEQSSTDLCPSAVSACSAATSGPGYLTYVYARPAAGGPWVRLGSTCYPDEAIAVERNEVTLADIQHEFASTPFASPTATIQPPGGDTLVTLPIYYSTTWTTTGYRPEQTRSLVLLGHPVDVRIALVSYLYDHGDGFSTGPTVSPGGPYPDGDVTHSYSRAGTYTPTITATLTASYRIDGGPWAPVQGTATRATTLPPITVHTATNRLRAD